jgi:hypothetical protein
MTGVFVPDETSPEGAQPPPNAILYPVLEAEYEAQLCDLLMDGQSPGVIVNFVNMPEHLAAVAIGICGASFTSAIQSVMSCYSVRGQTSCDADALRAAGQVCESDAMTHTWALEAVNDLGLRGNMVTMHVDQARIDCLGTDVSGLAVGLISPETKIWYTRQQSVTMCHEFQAMLNEHGCAF